MYLISADLPPTIDIISDVLAMLAGMAVLLLGLRLMSQHLETAFGSRLRRTLDKVGNNRFAGFGLGAGVTAILQSSSATTAMTVGLVNTGLLTLYQATNIIIGANFGTTITALLVSLQGVSLISPILAACALIGMFITILSKKRVTKEIGGVITGFGLIFAGLFFMNEFMSPLLEIPSVKNAFSTISNPFLLILIGILVTALVQSSTATIAILIPLIESGVLPLYNAMLIVLGANMGTSVTAVVISLGARTNARRAAYVHVLFNVFGLILFGIILFTFPNCYKLLQAIAPDNESLQISLFHIFFNLITGATLILLAKQVEKLLTKLIKDKRVTTSELLTEYVYIDPKLKPNASVIMTDVRKEIENMARLAQKNLSFAVNAVLNKNTDKKQEFDIREKNINFLNREIAKYLVEITALSLPTYESKVIGTYFHTVTDVERIGDYAENIIEYAETAQKENIGFSDNATAEIKALFNATFEQLEVAISAFKEISIAALSDLKLREDKIDELTEQLKNSHIKRMSTGECSATAGSHFIALTSNLERIADHSINIVMVMKDYCINFN